MSELDKTRPQQSEARASAFDDVGKLLTGRICELEAERVQKSKGRLTIADGIELLGSLERIDELRDVNERVTRLRDAHAEGRDPASAEALR